MTKPTEDNFYPFASKEELKLICKQALERVSELETIATGLMTRNRELEDLFQILEDTFNKRKVR